MTMGHGIYGLPEPELPKKPPSKWRYLWRTAFAVLFFVCMVMFVLSRADGVSDSNKKLMEEIFSESVASNFKIGTLNALSYSPLVAFDMSNVTFGERSKIERVQFATGLLSWFISKIEFRALGLRNGVVEGGALMFPRDLDIDELFIDPTNLENPILRFKGRYDRREIQITAPMRFKPTLLGHPRFVFPREMNVNVQWGDISADILIVKPLGARTSYYIQSLKQENHPNEWRGLIDICPTWKGAVIEGYFESDEKILNFLINRPADESKNMQGTISVDQISDPVWDDLLRVIRILRTYYKGPDGLDEINIGNLDISVLQKEGAESRWIIQDKKLISNPFLP